MYERSHGGCRAHSPSYFAANQENSFMSRRAYLHADAHAANGSFASASIRLAHAGNFTVLVRYEALYRFETPFLVTVAQGGRIKLQRMYGSRGNLKLWGYPYGGNQCDGLRTECVWPWGSVDNTVFEGVNTTVQLDAGSATITISVLHVVSHGMDPVDAHFADRNIDLVLLHPNRTDVDMRLVHEKEQVFDGLLSQAGEVFFQVQNTGGRAFNLSVPEVDVSSPRSRMSLRNSPTVGI
jgi:hypothetical protein